MNVVLLLMARIYANDVCTIGTIQGSNEMSAERTLDHKVIE